MDLNWMDLKIPFAYPHNMICEYIKNKCELIVHHSATIVQESYVTQSRFFNLVQKYEREYSRCNSTIQ